MEKNSRTQQKAPPSQPLRIEDWPVAPSIPRDDLVVVFHGLLSFCYNEAQRHCEVGVYGKSPKHNLEIVVQGGTCDKPIPPSNQLSRNTPHTLELVGGTPPGTNFYKPASSPFSRLSDPPPNQYDFRWLLDLEGPDFYDEIIYDKKHAFYRPRLFVKTGTFYTLERTFSTFKRVNLEDESEYRLGTIAYCIAANIEIEFGQEARLTLYKNNIETVVCRFPYGGGPYKISFTNVCQEAGEPCTRNDYFHHFASFNPPSAKPPFALELDEDRAGTDVHQCGPHSAKKSNDEAPCGSAGYGGTPGQP